LFSGWLKKKQPHLLTNQRLQDDGIIPICKQNLTILSSFIAYVTQDSPLFLFKLRWYGLLTVKTIPRQNRGLVKNVCDQFLEHNHSEASEAFLFTALAFMNDIGLC